MERVHIVGIVAAYENLFVCTVCCVEEDIYNKLNQKLKTLITHTTTICKHTEKKHNTNYMDSLHEPVNTLARICRAVLFHTADSAHKQVLLCSHNTDYMDSLHEPVNILARIW